jgi:hypothetical protein
MREKSTKTQLSGKSAKPPLITCVSAVEDVLRKKEVFSCS